jgi:hypothetical protein
VYSQSNLEICPKRGFSIDLSSRLVLQLPITYIFKKSSKEWEATTTFEAKTSYDLPAGDKVARHDDDCGEDDEDRQQNRENDERLRHLNTMNV